MVRIDFPLLSCIDFGVVSAQMIFSSGHMERKITIFLDYFCFCQ